MNQPEGSYLRINRKVSVECDCDNGKRPELRRVGNLRPSLKTGRLKECYRCHGTGRAKRRIKGWVPGPHPCDIDLEAKALAEAEYPDDLLAPGALQLATLIRDARVKIINDHIERIVAAYLDGTLPPELAENIKEVDDADV